MRRSKEWDLSHVPARVPCLFRLGFTLRDMCIIWVILIFGCQNGLSFNVDTQSAVIQSGQSGAMFGFAVSLHRDNGNSWLLVGAPKAQTDQPAVERGGAVYKCSIDVQNSCQQIPFDKTGSKKIMLRNKLEQQEEKSNQWFGATVFSSGENGIIVACAPRYVYHSSNMKRRDPVGTCWTSKSSFSGFQEYSPCRTSAWGYHRQGFCQAGFSAAISKNGRRLFIGAVGSFYWQGQVFSQDIFSRQSLRSTNESPETNDDSFLGYSTATGEFTGDADADVVVGMPRGSNLSGQVVLYNSSLHNLLNITGEQMGSYFGYSVCISDVNGDGLDDIIVGAPLYTDLKAKDGSYEFGRVDIIYQNKNHEFKRRTQLDGDKSKGRFGLSLASLKDIDRDGYQDFAVGAPYAGEDGSGVVYIFHGSKTGVMTKPSQTITAASVGAPMLRTFGFSISGGLDTDNNEYPDLLIGAYESDKAVFLRSRPVVTIQSSLKLDPENISLDSKGCNLKDGTLVSCGVVSLCLQYSGVRVNSELDFIYETTLDATQVNSRINFHLNETLRSSNVTVRLRKEDRYCSSVLIYIKTETRDKLTPITVQIRYYLVEKPSFRFNNELSPIISNNTSNVLTKQINILKNCGTDNLCIPDLILEVTPNMDRYLIGTQQRLEIDVKIRNKGEDAFESMLYFRMPLEVSYINIDKTKLGQDSQITCVGADPESTGVNELICDIGNPLPANKSLNFKILLAPSKIISGAKTSELTFTFEVNSTNAENDTSQADNSQTIILPVRVQVELVVDGVSNPALLTYNVSDIYPEDKNEADDIGPEVIHTYRVGNTGLSAVRQAVVYILWPTHTLDNDHLLYLLEQPIISGNAKCENAEVNPLKVRTTIRKAKGKTVRINDLKTSNAGEESSSGSETVLREKRYVEEDRELLDELDCGDSKCQIIKCSITNLKNENPVIFKMRSRLWPQTVTKMNLDEVAIQSKLVVKVLSLPYDVNPSYLGIQKFWVKTFVNPIGLSKGYSSIPLWIILLAVCGGLLVLGLLALLLWRLGFFKRKRHQDEEPLQKREKNGYQLAKGDAEL